MEIKNIKNKLRDLYNQACKEDVSIYIVGGFIRDLMMGYDLSKKIDIDFTLNTNIASFTKKVSDKFKADYIILNRDFNTIRIIIRDFDFDYQMDFTEFKGKTIQEDLYKRDFTVNAVAIELGKFLNAKSKKDLRKYLIYPTNTLKHFCNKKIVSVNSNSLIDDSLRMLRAFSIGAHLTFEIEKNTLREINENKMAIHKISFERIRDEIFRLLSTDNSYKYILKMAETGLFDEIFPELKNGKNIEQGPYHKFDVYYHSLECIKQFESILGKIYQDDYLRVRLKKILEDYISGYRSQKALLKLALLYHDVGKPNVRFIEDGKIKFWGHEKVSQDITEEMAKRYRLSNAEMKSLKNMVYNHMRPGHLVEQKESTKKARYRFFKDAGLNTPLVILLSIADKYATAGELITKQSMRDHEKFLIKLLKEYFHIQERIEPEKLIDGNDIMKILDIKPSPMVGKIIEEVELLQMQNKIKNKKQAIAFIEKYKI